MMGIVVPATCWVNNKICNKKPLLHLVGNLFPHINDDARSKSHQILSNSSKMKGTHKHTMHGDVGYVMVSFQRRKVGRTTETFPLTLLETIKLTKPDWKDKIEVILWSNVATSCYKAKRRHGTIHCLRLTAAQNGCKATVSFVTRLRFHLIILHALTLYQMFVLCVKNLLQVQHCNIRIWTRRQ